jgi:hypothetical protein
MFLPAEMTTREFLTTATTLRETIERLQANLGRVDQVLTIRGRELMREPRTRRVTDAKQR